MSNSYDPGRIVSDEVCDIARDSVWGSVWANALDSVWGSVRDSVRVSVWGSVRDSVRMVVNDGLKLFLSLENKSNGKEN